MQRSNSIEWKLIGLAIAPSRAQSVDCRAFARFTNVQQQNVNSQFSTGHCIAFNSIANCNHSTVIRPTGSTEHTSWNNFILSTGKRSRRLDWNMNLVSFARSTLQRLSAEAPQDFLPTFNIQLFVVYWYNSLLIFDMPFNCYSHSDNRNCWNGWRAWLYHFQTKYWLNERTMTNICRRVKIQQATVAHQAVPSFDGDIT